MRDENEQSLGFFRGFHYTDYVEEVKQLKRENNLIEAEKLLLGLIDSVEQESYVKKWVAAPWYYKQLSIVYRKQQRYQDEISILERYCHWQYNTPKIIEPFLLRIEKVKDIMRKEGAEVS